MSYNKDDVSYYRYHYDTGYIDFSKEKWKERFDKRINKNKFFNYIKDNNLNQFVSCFGIIGTTVYNKKKRVR